MNICIVLISDGMGGAEVFVHDLAHFLSCSDEKVFLILNDEMVKYFKDVNAVDILDIGQWPTHRFISPKNDNLLYATNKIFRLISIYNDELARFFLAKRLAKKIRDFNSNHKIDIIHSNRAESDIFLSLANVSNNVTISTVHGEHALVGRTSLSVFVFPIILLKSWLFRRALMRTQMICAVSESESRALREFGIPQEKVISVIHNGIDLSVIQRSIGNSSVNTSEFNILFPGGAKWYKGGDNLVAALPILKKKIPNFHLYIGSTVDLEDSLRKQVADIGMESQVSFIGSLDRFDYLNYLKAVDVFILPSRYEASPISLLEAMALGKPIIATRVGGIPEVIENGRNGLLIDGTPDSIAEAISIIASSKEIQRRMSQANLIDVEEYNWPIVLDRYESIYRTLIESN